jgi:hypothetical protein
MDLPDIGALRRIRSHSIPQGVFMHFAKKTRLAAGLAAALGLAVCAGGWSDAALADKPSAKPAPAVAASAGSATVLANDILNRWESIAQAAGAHSELWREITGTQLGMMSTEMLQRLASVSADGSAKAAYGRFNEAFVSAIMHTHVSGATAKVTTKDLGSATTDQVFLPITPCRIVDSRNAGGGGVISFGQQRDYYFYANAASPTWSWSTQGGQAGTAVASCPGTTLAAGGTLGSTPPSAAVATVQVVSPTAAGNFLIWGGAGALPTSSALNWAAGQTLANTTVIPAGGRGAGVLDFTVYYNGPSGAAHVVVDVIGYFVQSGATALQCNLQTNIGVGAANFPTGTNFQLSFPGCTAGYSATGNGCGYNGNIPAAAYLQESTPFFGYCNWFNNSGQTLSRSSFYAETRCCRVPGQ